MREGEENEEGEEEEEKENEDKEEVRRAEVGGGLRKLWRSVSEKRLREVWEGEKEREGRRRETERAGRREEGMRVGDWEKEEEEGEGGGRGRGAKDLTWASKDVSGKNEKIESNNLTSFRTF